MNAEPSQTVQLQIQRYKEQALNRLAAYLIPLLLIAAPSSMLRTHNQEWPNLCVPHYTALFVAIIVLILGERIPYKLRVYCYIGLGLGQCFVELSEYGLASGGAFAAVYCLMLPLFYLNRKSTLFVLPLVLGIYGYCMHAFVYGGRMLPGSDIHDMASLSLWIGVLVAGLVFFCLIGLSVLFLQERGISLLEKLERSNQTIYEQKRQIEHLANHDTLTGLPSLRVADVRLDSVLKLADQDGHHSALLFLDLDGFKAVNDTYGHEAGDVVLRVVAQRILSVIRATDTACRAGGDEFLVVIEKVDQMNDMSKLCARLVDVISQPVAYNDVELTVGVSIGAASYPGCADNARSLRVKADELMYQVKKNGKNNYLISGCDGQVMGY